MHPLSTLLSGTAEGFADKTWCEKNIGCTDDVRGDGEQQSCWFLVTLRSTSNEEKPVISCEKYPASQTLQLGACVSF